MAELPLIGLTALAGYLLSQPKKVVRESLRTSVKKVDSPNGDTVYSSNVVNEANQEILQRSLKNYKDAETPELTGVLPPLYNVYTNTKTDPTLVSGGSNIVHPGASEVRSKITDFNKQVDPTQLGSKIAEISDRPMFKNFYGQLKGSVNPSKVSPFNTNVDQEVSLLTGLPMDRTHNNMVPFFGGNIKQKVETFSNVGLLDRHTGYSSTYKPKQETTPFFEKTVDNIFGAPVFTTQVDQDRYIQSNLREGEKPFQPERVAAPIAGTVDNAIIPKFKEVNDLRPGNRPKDSYEGRLLSGKMGETRGVHGDVYKRRPDTYYEKTDSHHFRGPGGYVAITSDPNFDPLSTARSEYNGEFTGPVGQSQLNNFRPRVVANCESTIDACAQDPKRETFANDFNRNDYAANTERLHSDYGKGGMSAYGTERQTYDTKPLGNMKLPDANASRLQDAAKTTVRETMSAQARTGHLKTVFDSGSSVAYDSGIASVTAKDTMKQFVGESNYMGQASTSDGMGYLVNKYTAKVTDKEILAAQEGRRGNAENLVTHTTYNTYQDPQKVRNAVHVDYQGHAKTHQPASAIQSTYKDPEKVRYAIHPEYMGQAANQNTVTSRQNYNNAETRDTREVSFSGARPSGPQQFQIAAGKSAQGDYKITPSMLFKETETTRASGIEKTIQPTPYATLIGETQQSKSLDNVYESRFDPKMVLKQLDNNPFVINKIHTQ
ncbi:hypothetical protein EB118_15435 [bacterium]|nr:hypothetical protein [bacterium]NDG31446.1 hypothetical protein [bacterium]